MSETAWDAVEHSILSAVQQQPGSCQRIAATANLTPDVVKAQLSALEREGVVTQEMPGSGRYHLTLVGHKRMFALADTTTDRPGHKAAA